MFEKFRNAFRRVAVAVCVALAGAFAFAQESGDQIDTSVASNALESLVNAVKSFVGTAAPFLVGLLGAGLGLLLIWKVWAWLKKGTNKAG